MGNLRRYYYANKTKIWRSILIVAFILVLIRILNYMAGKPSYNIDNTVNYNNKVNTVVSDSSLTTDKSITSSVNIDETVLKNDITIIDQFLNLCNSKQFEQAYELVSEECKQNLFSTYDVFKRTYCDVVFNNYKTYTTENWSGQTYKVRITEDPLATGNTSSGMAIQEYITIVQNDGESKLNINNYIGRKNIHSTETKNDITIEVVSCDMYLEYEVYNIIVKNNTGKIICLDNGEESFSMYIQDDNGVKYEVSTSEIIYSTLKVLPGSSMKYNIKFTNTYRTNRVMEKIVFNKVILDINNKSEYNNSMNIEVTL